MSKYKRALAELAGGFHIRSAEPEQFMPGAALLSSNPWDVLGAILIRAQRGDFSELHRIEALLRASDEWLFWYAATEFFSLATSWHRIVLLAESLRDRQEEETAQYFLAILFGNACDLRAVEPLLNLHRQSNSDDVRYEVERNLSHLLEPTNGPLWWGADEKEIELDEPDEEGRIRTLEVDKKGYATVIRKASADLETALQTTIVFGAQPFAVGTLADRLNKRLMEAKLQSDRIAHERMILEASTGIDCSGFSDPAGKLMQLDAAAILAEILDSDLSRFEPGQRYFFGHPIPD
jgi:hypothetical protein